MSMQPFYSKQTEKSDEYGTEFISNGTSKFTHMNSEQAEALKSLEQLDLLPMILSLMDDISKQKVSAKDVHNTAGPIRSKLAAAKRRLEHCEGLDVSVDERKKLGNLYMTKIRRKRKLLQEFQQVMNGDESFLLAQSPSRQDVISAMDIDKDMMDTIEDNTDFTKTSF